MDKTIKEDYMSFEIKVHDRRIVYEYWADGEWHYKYKI